MKKELSLLFFLIVAWQVSYGQLVPGDSSILLERQQMVMAHYEDTFVAPILSGKGYHPDYRYAVNSPYFGGEGLERGSLHYDQVLYTNLEVKYDLVAGQLVVQLDSRRSLQLVIIDLDKVSGFTIGDARFDHIRTDSVMSEGIYQLVYSGQNTGLFAERSMLKDEEVSHTDVVVEFKPVNRYYIRNQDGTFPISNRKSFIKAFANNPTVKSMLKRNNIRFSKNFIEQDLVRALVELDSTTP